MAQPNGIVYVMPGGTELIIDPPGGDGAGDELEYELLVDKYAMPRARAEPDGDALESGPRQSDGIPEAHLPVIMHADQGEMCSSLRERRSAPYMLIRSSMAPRRAEKSMTPIGTYVKLRDQLNR